MKIINTKDTNFKAEFEWPVDQARLTRGFLPHARPRPHLGLDLASKKGTPVLSASDGHVIYAGSGFRGFGRFIIIEHEGDWASFYGHLDKILIKQGEFIKKGTLIGKMGRTGRATGTHLHFEIRDSSGSSLPPSQWLETYGAVFLGEGC